MLLNALGGGQLDLNYRLPLVDLPWWLWWQQIAAGQGRIKMLASPHLGPGVPVMWLIFF